MGSYFYFSITLHGNFPETFFYFFVLINTPILSSPCDHMAKNKNNFFYIVREGTQGSTLERPGKLFFDFSITLHGKFLYKKNILYSLLLHRKSGHQLNQDPPQKGLKDLSRTYYIDVNINITKYSYYQALPIFYRCRFQNLMRMSNHCQSNHCQSFNK
jgi:hypothetical protein